MSSRCWKTTPPRRRLRTCVAATLPRPVGSASGCVLRSATSTPSNSPLSIANEILDLIAAGATAERIERAARSHRLRTAAIAGCACC